MKYFVETNVLMNFDWFDSKFNFFCLVWIIKIIIPFLIQLFETFYHFIAFKSYPEATKRAERFSNLCLLQMPFQVSFGIFHDFNPHLHIYSIFRSKWIFTVKHNWLCSSYVFASKNYESAKHKINHSPNEYCYTFFSMSFFLCFSSREKNMQSSSICIRVELPASPFATHTHTI